MNEQKKQNNQKLEASLSQLSSKQRSEAEAEAREQRKWKTYGIITAIVLVLVAALLFWDAGFVQRSASALKVGNEGYSAVDLDYYYYTQYNSVSTYASYYGLDTSKSLKEQTTYTGETWYDYLREQAKAELTEVSTLAQEAKAEGYIISEDGQKNIDEMMNSLTSVANSNNVTEKYYLSRVFGRHMTPEIFKRNVEEYYYAVDFQSSKANSFEVSDEEINSYYEENKNTLDTYDFDCYSIEAKAESTTDEEGNIVEATDEENAAAAAAAKKLANELEKAIKAGDSKKVAKLVADNGLTDFSDLSSENFAYYSFNDWITDAGRKAGDTTVSEETMEETVDSAESGANEADASASAEPEAQTKTVITNYYVLKFNNRYIDNYHGANLRTVTVNANAVESEDEAAETTYDYDTAKATAEELQAAFVANGATEEAFIALDSHAEAETETEDEHHHGALEENISKGAMADEIDTWVFGAGERKAGDYTIVKDEDNQCYQLVYFVGWSDMSYWQTVAQSNIRDSKYSAWYEEATKKYQASTTWLYSQVG